MYRFGLLVVQENNILLNHDMDLCFMPKKVHPTFLKLSPSIIVKYTKTKLLNHISYKNTVRCSSSIFDWYAKSPCFLAFRLFFYVYTQ